MAFNPPSSPFGAVSSPVRPPRARPPPPLPLPSSAASSPPPPSSSSHHRHNPNGQQRHSQAISIGVPSTLVKPFRSPLLGKRIWETGTASSTTRGGGVIQDWERDRHDPHPSSEAFSDASTDPLGGETRQRRRRRRLGATPARAILANQGENGSGTGTGSNKPMPKRSRLIIPTPPSPGPDLDRALEEFDWGPSDREDGEDEEGVERGGWRRRMPLTPKDGEVNAQLGGDGSAYDGRSQLAAECEDGDEVVARTMASSPAIRRGHFEFDDGGATALATPRLGHFAFSGEDEGASKLLDAAPRPWANEQTGEHVHTASTPARTTMIPSLVARARDSSPQVKPRSSSPYDRPGPSSTLISTPLLATVPSSVAPSSPVLQQETEPSMVGRRDKLRERKEDETEPEPTATKEDVPNPLVASGYHVAPALWAPLRPSSPLTLDPQDESTTSQPARAGRMLLESPEALARSAFHPLDEMHAALGAARVPEGGVEDHGLGLGFGLGVQVGGPLRLVMRNDGDEEEDGPKEGAEGREHHERAEGGQDGSITSTVLKTAAAERDEIAESSSPLRDGTTTRSSLRPENDYGLEEDDETDTAIALPSADEVRSSLLVPVVGCPSVNRA